MIEKDAERFNKDNFAISQAGIKILAAEKGYAKCEMPITNNHLNADGVVMGGAIFTLADFTASLASNMLNDKCVTLNGNIHFLSPADTKVLFAETKMIKNGKSIAVCDVDITDDNGKLCAKYTGTGYRFSK